MLRKDKYRYNTMNYVLSFFLGILFVLNMISSHHFDLECILYTSVCAAAVGIKLLKSSLHTLKKIVYMQGAEIC